MSWRRAFGSQSSLGFQALTDFLEGKPEEAVRQAVVPSAEDEAEKVKRKKESLF